MELTLALILAWLVIAFQGWLIYLLMRQHGRALLHQDELRDRLATVEQALRELADHVNEVSQATRANENAVNNQHDLTAASLYKKIRVVSEHGRAAGLKVRESRLNRQGLSTGTPAPNFSLPDLKGIQHSLAKFHGRRVLLVFSDPNCGPCDALAAPLVQLYQQHRDNDLEVVMISRGGLEANLAKVKEHGLTFPVLLQRHWEISKEYAMFATPVAYLIDKEGVIADDVAIGCEAILQLV